jgi:hypothetical protein
MIITCNLPTGPRQNATHYTFRAGDFHHAKSMSEGVEVSIAIGNTGVTTFFYVSHDEWTRIEPLLVSAAPVPAPAATDSLEFSRLMYAWHIAKCKIDELPRSIDDMQAEKDAYFAIVAYINRPSPALPQSDASLIALWNAANESNKDRWPGEQAWLEEFFKDVGRHLGLIEGDK